MVDQEAVVAVADEDALEDTVEAMVVDETEEIVEEVAEVVKTVDE